MQNIKGPTKKFKTRLLASSSRNYTWTHEKALKKQGTL